MNTQKLNPKAQNVVSLQFNLTRTETITWYGDTGKYSPEIRRADSCYNSLIECTTWNLVRKGGWRIPPFAEAGGSLRQHLMATLENVQELLRNLNNVTASEISADVFPVMLRDTEVVLPETDVDDYLALRESVKLKPETSLFIPGYYEHAVDILGVRFGSGVQRLVLPDDERILLTSPSEQITIELSGISTRFLLAIFDKLDRAQMAHLRHRLVASRPETDIAGELPRLCDIFGKIMSVKVMASEEFRARTRQNKLKAIAEAGLFNISYARGVGMNLATSWESSDYRQGAKIDEGVQFPLRTYDPDLVAYYQFALSSESLIVAYLALYNILEYFYVATAEDELNRQMADKLVSPTFNYKRAAHLRSLASIVRTFDRRANERQMLSDVLEQYFTPGEIADWVLAHEADSGGYYTVKHSILGQSQRVDLEGDAVFMSVAKRLHHIHKALVYNNEGEWPRFIPFTGQDDVLMKELPLILFLAEQMIVKTGEDI